MHENTETRRVGNTLEVSKNIGRASGKTRPRYIVVPAGVVFFHITESATGRVKGFRRHPGEACALARTLEARPRAYPA